MSTGLSAQRKTLLMEGLRLRGRGERLCRPGKFEDICLRGGRLLSSESHPFLCEVGDKTIYQESEETCSSG